MPELPDITVYLDALSKRVLGRTLERVDIVSPFVLRSVEPPLASCHGTRVTGLRRLGKRIVLAVGGDLFLVIHLMIAGRLQWRTGAAKLGRRSTLAAFVFDSGTLVLTEAGTTRRASLHLVRGAEALEAFDRGGLEVLEAGAADFEARLRSENHTVKRALADPRLFSGIGNAYSDEILHRAGLSPMLLTGRMTGEQAARLHAATQATLREWIARLRARDGRRLAGEGDGVPLWDGGARAVPAAVPGVRRAGAADPLRRQRDRLLRPLPDRGQAAGGPRPVAAAQGRLAALARRAGGAHRRGPPHGALNRGRDGSRAARHAY